MFTHSARTTIEEVSCAHSPYLPGMGSWLLQIFPEYAPPRFDTLLMHLRQQNGRHEAQIFIARMDEHVAGLVQVLYRQGQNGLVADIDLLGVLEPHRRAGIGTALVKRAIRATQEMSHHYELPAVGVLSLVDLDNTPTLRLHKNLGGQIRSDLVYPSGELVVWHPLTKEYAAIETKALAEQLQQFGSLLRQTFSDAIGKIRKHPDQEMKELAR